jgi:hypothetical protein
VSAASSSPAMRPPRHPQLRSPSRRHRHRPRAHGDTEKDARKKRRSQASARHGGCPLTPRGSSLGRATVEGHETTRGQTSLRPYAGGVKAFSPGVRRPRRTRGNQKKPDMNPVRVPAK